MSNHELLLAISDMLDTKLKSELQPIKNEIQSLKEEVQFLKKEVWSLKEKVYSLADRVQSIEEDVQSLKEDVQSLKEDVQFLKGEVQSLKGEMHHMKLYQENVIVPRLDTIESCYTDTYYRYKNYADKMDSAFGDIGLLKKVVTEHSEKLQKLA